MKAGKIIIFAVVIGCLGVAGTGYWFYRYAATPTGISKATVAVWIKPGQNFFKTIAQLQQTGIIRHPKRFRLLAYLRRDERRIRAGEYLLGASMSPGAILDVLVRGEVLLHKVVVPEGATVSTIAQILESAGLVSQDAFLQAARDPRLIKSLGVGGHTFEGYLFPETYHFPKGVAAGQVIKKMVAQFHSVFATDWLGRARAIGFTTQQVVTLASIVEKETARPDERLRIAAVFVNRLKRGMRLESDPTVIYGIKDFDGNLTRKDLQTLTPYNTYRIKGLPPGPIASPGRASIAAVLYPSEEPHLYFVSKNDGTHHFSRTLAEHKKMVRKYQLRRH